MAFKRRSLALTLIAIGFAAQWIPWARIDRAAFQYHYYTALPFVVLALAYFDRRGLARRVAPRPGSWRAVAAALAIMGPALLWLFHRPLCAFVGVESVNPGSQACPAVIPDFVLTAPDRAPCAVVVGRRRCCSSSAGSSRSTTRDGCARRRSQWRPPSGPLVVTGDRRRRRRW